MRASAWMPLCLFVTVACSSEPLRGDVPAQNASPLVVVKAAGPPKPACAPLRPSVSDSAAQASLEAIPAPVPASPVAIDRVSELGPFYEKLAALARGRATDHVRIAVFGDSNLTMDFTTGRMRRRLSQRFGEGGHGFVALGKPWSHYRHMDVLHDVVRGFKAYAITTKPTRDSVYGLAGIAVENEYQGARTFVATAPDASPIGRVASSFDVFYLARPHGGAFDVELDHARVGHVDTASDDKALRVAHFSAPEGPHRLEVVSRSAAQIRVFGVALERTTPGIVVDAFGVGSLNSKTLARTEPNAFRAMAKDRHYDLVILMTGANDVFTMDAVPASLESVIGWIHEVLPDAPVMLMTPADRGIVRPFAQTLKVVAQRRELAASEGWPLWDQFAAMGGAGAMKHFVRAGLAYKDGVHFTERGGARMGDLFVDALLEGFGSYLDAHPDAGCESGLASSDQADPRSDRDKSEILHHPR